MKKLILLINVLFFSFGTAQNVSEKMEKLQGQDLNVPAPPKISFPAQFPGGNKMFLTEVEKNLDQSALKDLAKNSKTKIILKIGLDGKVINISTFGENKIFNDAVQKAATKATGLTKWIPGKNQRGEYVIDIVNLPFKFSSK